MPTAECAACACSCVVCDLRPAGQTSAEAAKRSPDLIVSRISESRRPSRPARTSRSTSRPRTAARPPGARSDDERVADQAGRGAARPPDGQDRQGRQDVGRQADGEGAGCGGHAHVRGLRGRQPQGQGAQRAQQLPHREVRRAVPRRPPPAPQPAPAPAPAPAPPSVPTPAPPTDGVDLAVADVSDPPAAAREGAQFSVTEATVNEGATPPPAPAPCASTFPDSEQSLQERGAAPHTALRDVRHGRRARARRARRAQAPQRGADAGHGPDGHAARLVSADRVRRRSRRRWGRRPKTTTAAPRRIRRTGSRSRRRSGCSRGREVRVDASATTSTSPRGRRRGDARGVPRRVLQQPVAGRLRPSSQAVVHQAFLAGARPMARCVASAAAPSPRRGAQPGRGRRRDRRAGRGRAGGADARARARAAARPRTSSTRPRSPPASGLPARGAGACSTARARLDDPDRPAMGISRHAVALANRGQALAMLGALRRGRPALAARCRRRAAARREADAGRAATTVCARVGPEAVARHLRAAAATSAAVRQLARRAPRSCGARAARRPEGSGAMTPFFQDQARSFQRRDRRQDRRAEQLERQHARQAERVDARPRTGATADDDAASTAPTRSPTSPPSRRSCRHTCSRRSSRSSTASGATPTRGPRVPRSFPTQRARGGARHPRANCFPQRMT